MSNITNSSSRPSPSTVHVVRAVVARESQILLLRRSQNCKRYVGAWELPGGTLQADETAYSGIIRELVEETTLRVLEASVIGDFNYVNGGRSIVVTVMFVGRVSGSVSISDEHDRWEWVVLSDLNEMLSPETRSCIDKIPAGVESVWY